MNAFLLDVNVLIALMWPAHEGHLKVQHWFKKNSNAGWATCTFTQTAFVRVLSNPAFSRDAVTPLEAIKVLSRTLQHPSHQFWKEEIGFADATRLFQERLAGHRRVTDAYLLGLALHMKGSLVTMGRGILSLLPEGCAERDSIALI
jgi:uncharacterized protein